jgi:beta-lactamase regulating signal transducer with metallopeptidase domain
MSALGLSFVWVAVQVTLLLVPVFVLHWGASRRGAAAGAWVASISFAFVLLLSALALLPGSFSEREHSRPVASAIIETGGSPSSHEETRSSSIDGSPAVLPLGSGWSLTRLISGWQFIGRSTTEQVGRVPTLAVGFAYLVVAGAAAGLLRLFGGIWAIARLRRRGRAIDDGPLQSLLAELTAELGCRRPVSLIQTSDPSAPATAGWLRPVILLPDDWRTWMEQDRRAVLAHELAHVERHDYAWTLLARFAVGLHFYHPLVHWLDGRLNWQQELAADALAARVAGGNELYLLTLSKLALRRDRYSPNWAARAFLPARGTLIRRIEMLRKLDVTDDRSWSWSRRSLAVVLLLGVTLGLSTFRGPALGESPGEAAATVKDGKAVAVSKERSGLEPFDFSFLPENPQGIAAIRPSEIFRLADMAGYRMAINLFIGTQWAAAAKTLGFDPTKPGQKPLRIEMFEQVSSPCQWGRGTVKFGGMVTVKTTEPIDWVQMARVWTEEPVEKHEGSHVYHELKKGIFGPVVHFYCPDARTLVIGNEKEMLAYFRRIRPTGEPVFAKEEDWQRLRRGLALIAIDNRDRSFVKMVTAKPDESDARVTQIAEQTDLITVGVAPGADSDLEVSAFCPDERASEATFAAMRSLLESARRVLSTATDPKAPEHSKQDDELAIKFFKKLEDARITREGSKVFLRSKGLGNVADLASFLSEVL